MNGSEILVFTNDSIYIESNPKIPHYVMHSAEKSLMHKLADITTVNGGNILEIGFGMGICSDRIQETPGILSHTIIEVHPEIYKRALEWSIGKNNVKVLLGDWIEVIPKIRDLKFDGVLHDTHTDRNISKLIEVVRPFCNSKCVVSFFNGEDQDLSAVVHQFEREEYESLPYKDIGRFKNMSYELKYTILE